jgi:hypothetical protein
MKPQEVPSDSDIQYQRLLAMLGRTEKYLEALNIDPSLLRSYKQLLRFLRSQPPETVAHILYGTVPAGEKVSKKPQPDLSEQEIRAMTIENIVALASNEKTPRRHLEQIATVRFGMTKGGLSALQNRHALLEKLFTLIGNENTHESIARAAGQQVRGRF